MPVRRMLSKILVVTAAVVAIGMTFRSVFPSVPSVSNPIKEVTVDRTGPAVLQRLDDLTDLHASTGELQVTVDVEKDVRYVPSAIAGERTMYQAVGTVDGVVNLSNLDQRSVIVGQDGRVTVVLPHATLSEVVLDLEQSKVIKRSRGLANRIGGAFSDNPTSERSLQVSAKAKLRDAAIEAGVLQKAERNAAAHIESLLTAAGATSVEVRFADPAPAPAA